MNLDDLKSNWKNAGGALMTDKEIEMMTKIGNHPTLKKVRLKMIIEIFLLSILLFVYYDGFDGDKKPILINALLVASVIIYIANNFIGYLFLKKPSTETDIKRALEKQIEKLKIISRFSLISSLVYGISLITFLTSQITFDQRKYILLAGIGIAFFLMFYYSRISWKRKIDHFRQMELEF